MQTIRTLAASLLLCALSTSALAALRSGDEFPLWGSKAATTREPAALHNNIVDVKEPSLVAFVPDQPNGIGIIVVPGGSYLKLVAAKEGADVARWLNSLGITAFVLLHRLPNEQASAGRHVPLRDGQRAIRLLRAKAGEWQLDPAKIGIMGFSAGGHLAAATGTAFNQASYPAGDTTDSLSARPDFMALIYPAVGFPADRDNRKLEENRAAFVSYATDEAAPANTPPTFMMVAANDGLARANVRFWQVLQQAGNPPELHIAATGGHGFALKPDAAPAVKVWPELFRTWLQTTGFLRSQ